MSLSASSAAHSNLYAANLYAANSYAANPYAALVQKQRATADSLFGTGSDHPAESAAAAMPLYQKPGLLHGVTQWDGSLKPGSQRNAKPADHGAAPVTPKYSFNPFDRKSWDVKPPKGSTVDTKA